VTGLVTFVVRCGREAIWPARSQILSCSAEPYAISGIGIDHRLKALSVGVGA